MRDHGGDLDLAVARYGGDRADWLDLSTGINPVPYPLGRIAPGAWAALPPRADIAALEAVAAQSYGAAGAVAALAGAQAAIQLVPALRPAGAARVLGPTYNEHAAALQAAGWAVGRCAAPDDLAGADLAVVVNPNNPDGARHAPEALRALSERVGLLVVDESFGDVAPELSVAGSVGARLIVLRSFGKFYGLAGLRLGFALAAEEDAARLREMAGPWPVSGPAIALGRRALADAPWAAAARARLRRDAARLDALAARAGWRLAGGTSLFRSYETGDAAAAQARLARARIWSRAFPWSPGWLRLGLPGTARDWARLEAAAG